LQRETLTLIATDAQQIVIFLPDDGPTAQAMARLQADTRPSLRAVN